MRKIIVILFCIIGFNNGYAETTKDKLSVKHAIQQVPKEAVSFPVLPATHAGRQWLQLLDQDKFAKSWQQASILVKKNISQDDFVKSAERTRLPLGSLEKRTVIMVQPKTEMPGAPKGKYVLMTFKSKFNNKAEDVTEMLMLQEDPDKQWRVAAYFLQ